MNSHITVESSPGQGSTFPFWLPAAGPQADRVLPSLAQEGPYERDYP